MPEAEEKKIFVAGHGGMVGSAIVRQLEGQKHHNIIVRSKAQLDLLDALKLGQFLKDEHITDVYLAAAKVGGIHANDSYPAEFIYNNLMIEANVINQAYMSGISRLLFLGSSCIYPKLCPQPMTESSLLTGELEPTNAPYAIAKIAGIKLCESYNRQYDTDYRSVMPTNLYGPNDNFHPDNSHVIPGLIHRIHQAKSNSAPSVTIWGTGSARREFLHVDDMACACLFVMNLENGVFNQCVEPTLSHINVGTGKEISIKELATTIARVVGYQGKLEFDKTKPDGTPRKLLDVSKLSKLGWKYSIELENGLSQTYDWFCNNLDQIRQV